MDVFHQDANGNDLVPIWSLKQNTFWCSLSGLPNDIPQDAIRHMNSLQYLLRPASDKEISDALDWTKRPVWYNPEEHWLGWTPRGPLLPIEDDPIAFVFDDTPVILQEQLSDVGTDSDDGQPKVALAGYEINSNWTERTIAAARRLQSICSTVVSVSDFYNESPWTGPEGDTPEPLDESKLTGVHWNAVAARGAACDARKVLLSYLGFLSWIQTIQPLWSTAVSEEDWDYARSLRLDERSKMGVLYNLARDLHEMNFKHLLQHNVPIHYPWTKDVRDEARFLRLSPEYWNEYSLVKAESGEGETDVQKLPSYNACQKDLDRFDWFFQDLKAGKRGGTVTGFNPKWEYRVIDFRLYGARTILHWNVIRAYAGRFKAALQISRTSSVCLFFRQNPFEVDEPPFDRVWPENPKGELTDFADEERGEYVAEEDAFFEATSIVRERVKNKWAPRPARLFNSFNGLRDGVIPAISLQREYKSMPRSGTSNLPEEGEARAGSLKDRLGGFAPEGYMSPTRRSERTEDRGITSRWARERADGRVNSPPREVPAGGRRGR
ncbi:hypothetical protein C8R44DRAFT_990950 [Mycena epipterygia]|nr:hypothetical protein C8R44DRAFT_990950 [Mycena epipterygia]